MRNKKNKVIILIALVLSLILLGIFQVLRSEKQRHITPKVKIAFDQNDDFSQVENIIKEILVEGVKEIDESHFDSIAGKYKNFEQLRDPFAFPKTQKPAAPPKTAWKQPKTGVKPAKPKAKPEPRFEIKGIIFDKENPIAIINGEIYKVGDIINSYRVVRITKEGVKLVSRYNQIFLKAPEFN